MSSNIYIYTLIYICLNRVDGEPSALAKYVVALIKKDKPTSELRTSCQEQLEVFLNDGKFQIQFIYLFFPLV